ncbi:uncharacterized protein [Solanum tuberosum]|uniref:uncharacterized protein n=1 Tax=Solanum tuberosum TaxID=4113 RepID=UPI00073A30CA|nr:PREDICTED: uncharacterized protein LOC107057967 [Solanum tuberosum]
MDAKVGDLGYTFEHSAEQRKREEERDKDMAHMRTQIDLLTKHIISKSKKVNAVGQLNRNAGRNYSREGQYDRPANREQGKWQNRDRYINDRSGVYVSPGVKEMKGDFSSMSQLVDSHTTSIKQSEQQLGQLSASLNQRKNGSLPSDTIQNPKMDGHCMAIARRSGKILNDPIYVGTKHEQVLEQGGREEDEAEQVDELEDAQPIAKPAGAKRKRELKQMPRYAKFMKDLVTKKRAISIDLTDNVQHCSAIATGSQYKLDAAGHLQAIGVTMMAAIEVFDEEEIGATIEERLAVETLTAVLMNFEADFRSDYVETVNALQVMGAHAYAPKKLDLDLKNRPSPPAKPSIEEPPVLELKQLPSHLSYNQKSIAPEDQEKTTFTCPYGTFAFKRMPFGHCNAPTTFQRCMMSIFSDMVEDTLEVFMDDFSVVGIVLGHKVSQKGLEVDKAKIEVIEKWSPPICVKGVRSFLVLAGFYRRFIKDFSKIAHPMCKLLEKEVNFFFDEACLKAFECLKEKLIFAPMIIGPDWAEPFEVICDANCIALGVVLGQKRNKMFHLIYYASKSLNGAQRNYTVKDRKGCDNQVVDHLSRLEAEKKEELELEINDSFLDEQVLASTLDLIPWFADFANFLVSDLMPEGLTFQQRKRFLHDVGKYFWDEPYLYKVCADNIIRRCIPEAEMLPILEACHSSPVGGHHGGAQTTHKILQCGYYWTGP